MSYDLRLPLQEKRAQNLSIKIKISNDLFTLISI